VRRRRGRVARPELQQAPIAFDGQHSRCPGRLTEARERTLREIEGYRQSLGDLTERGPQAAEAEQMELGEAAEGRGTLSVGLAPIHALGSLPAALEGGTPGNRHTMARAAPCE